MKTQVANPNLADVLDQHTTVAAPELVRQEGDRIRCLACGHRCLIGDGLRGICKVRYNEHGELRVPFGYVAGLQCDPVEKKPFFHVYPGTDALTFGMMGCDLHCGYCQNWLTSQALRDRAAKTSIRPVTASQLVDFARREKARLVVSSYNEPLITAEWAVAVFREATAAGLACAFVSNGNATPEALDFVRPWIVAYKIDLKSFNERSYRTLGGTLEAVTRSIQMVRERGLWLEVVTLVIPGFNDSDDELGRAAGFLASVSPDIPWHVTAFHKDYKMTDPDPTSADTLLRAAAIGTGEGLRYVYAGNLPGRVGEWENTRCPTCRATVIERYGYLIRSYRLEPGGRCPDCGTQLPGIWPGSADDVRTGNTLDAYRGRLPRPVAASLPVIEPPAPQLQGTTPMPIAEQPVAPPRPTPPGRPNLAEEQKQQLVTAAAAMLRATVAGQPTALPPDLTELGKQVLSGAFVSVKRGGHLRSCCGMLGSSIALAQALEQAIYRTAWEDARFPPLSPSELDHLDMEVWLLHSPERVQAQGEERLQAITLGRHGVQVARGGAHALFLPSVAVESNWDVRRLLDQVCIKAGLPREAWREDDTVLSTFEGEVLRGRTAGSEPAPRRPGVCQPHDVLAYGDFCIRELAAMLARATPSYYFWGAPDGNVNGVVLLLQQPGQANPLGFSRFSLRPGLPLQTTLYSINEAAAQQLTEQGVRLDQLVTLQVSLAFLHDVAMHGTVADPHLAGIDTRHRAVMVVERNKSCLVYDPARTPEELLAEATAQARVTQPGSAAIYSLEVLSNAPRFRAVTGTRGVAGPDVRPPAVAGTFYEADPAELARTVDELLAGERRPERWPAAMVPHAGLRYSGRIAADVLRRLRIPRSVIILGPKHTPLGVDWAVAPHRTWSLPGRTLESDQELARRLCQAIPGLEADAAAHQREHAVEVELPLLARLAPSTRVVGIAIGAGDLESCRRFATGLAQVLRGLDEPPLLLISSDMNHFATDAENRRLDMLALEAIEKRDPAHLYNTVVQHQISMCGVLPAVIVMETLRQLGGLQKTERVGYATTADVTGDTSRVVGYAGVLLG